jgi:hypothetical protein
MSYTVEQLQRLKSDVQTEKEQKNQVDAKIAVLGEEIKKKFEIGSLKELTEMGSKVNADRIMKETSYEKDCEQFREKWDM